MNGEYGPGDLQAPFNCRQDGLMRQTSWWTYEIEDKMSLRHFDTCSFLQNSGTAARKERNPELTHSNFCYCGDEILKLKIGFLENAVKALFVN